MLDLPKASQADESAVTLVRFLQWIEIDQQTWKLDTDFFILPHAYMSETL